MLEKESVRIWSSAFLQYYWEFALGMVIADSITKNKNIFEGKSNFLLLVIGLVSCGIYGFLALKAGEVGKLFNDVFGLIGYSLLAVVLYNIKLIKLNQFFVFFGKISFSVYLLHVLLINILSQLFNTLSLEYLVILALLLIIPVSVAYQKGISKFFTNQKNVS